MELKEATKQGLINELILYDPSSPTIRVILEQIERKWQYAKIASLKQERNTLVLASPWSHQLVAGRQLLADDQGPEIEASLLRPSVSQVVSSGDVLEGFVGTWYTLVIKARDRVALADLQLSQKGKELKAFHGLSSPTASLRLPQLFFTGVQQQEYQVKAVDHAGNVSLKTIKLHIDVPELSLVSVEKLSDEKARITAELSQDIDRGFVSFQKQRQGAWQNLLTEGGVQNFPLAPKKTKIVGESYNLDQRVGMYDKNKKLIATLDPHSGKISLETPYKNKASLQASMQDGRPVVQVITPQHSVLFTITFAPLQLIKIIAPAYQIDKIEDASFGKFTGGYRVSRQGREIMMVAPSGEIFSEYPLV